MLNNVTAAVSNAIYNEFCNDFKIYTEKVPQKFTRPAFSVKCIESKNERFLGRRYKSTNKIQVDFFADEENKRYVTNDVIHRLTLALEYITLEGDPIKTLNIDTKKSDDCFTCTFNVDYFFYIVEESELMKNMELTFMENLQ
jgi:hypothetical protein